MCPELCSLSSFWVVLSLPWVVSPHAHAGLYPHTLAVSSPLTPKSTSRFATEKTRSEGKGCRLRGVVGAPLGRCAHQALRPRRRVQRAAVGRPGRPVRLSACAGRAPAPTNPPSPPGLSRCLLGPPAGALTSLPAGQGSPAMRGTGPGELQNSGNSESRPRTNNGGPWA